MPTAVTLEVSLLIKWLFLLGKHSAPSHGTSSWNWDSSWESVQGLPAGVGVGGGGRRQEAGAGRLKAPEHYQEVGYLLH